MKNIIIVFTLFSIIFGCASRKDVVYFQSSLKSINQSQNQFNEIQISKYDVLNVNVSALDLTSVSSFLNSQALSKTSDQYLLEGYRVSRDGYITLPLVGNILVSGLSCNEAADLIENELSKKIIEPVVNINIVNFKVTVLGEVNNPGTFQIYDTKLTIVQALGYAGDLTINGKKNNIKIIREINDVSIIREIDLTKPDFISSEFFYLKNNDVLYIEPSFANIKNSGYIGQISSIATIFSLIMSIIILSKN